MVSCKKVARKLQKTLDKQAEVVLPLPVAVKQQAEVVYNIFKG